MKTFIITSNGFRKYQLTTQDNELIATLSFKRWFSNKAVLQTENSIFEFIPVSFLGIPIEVFDHNTFYASIEANGCVHTKNNKEYFLKPTPFYQYQANFEDSFGMKIINCIGYYNQTHLEVLDDSLENELLYIFFYMTVGIRKL